MDSGSTCVGCLQLAGLGGQGLSLRSKQENSFSSEIDFRFKNNQEKRTILPYYSRNYNRHAAIRESDFYFFSLEMHWVWLFLILW